MRRREAPVGAVCLILLVAAESFAQVAILTDFEQHGRFIERSDILEFDDALFFGVGVRGSDQRELWKFDGNQAQLVSDRFIGARDSSIDEFVSFRGELYFTADDGDTGTELWRYDGTRVSLAADVEPGANGSRPTGLVVHNDHLMFSAQNGNSYSNLWSFDGTQANLIARFGNPSSSISTGATIGSDFYFGADDGVHGSELWRYDGRDIHHVADIEPGNVGSFPRNLVAIDETLYFAAQTTDAGREVWKYDGQSVQMIDDINASNSWSNPLHLTERGGQLYFSAARSRERFMWEYDGAVLTQMGQGGGPIFDANRPLLLRGHREGDVEVQELWEMTARGPRLFRGLTPSAGPFALLQDELYLTCTCNSVELMKLAVEGDANQDGDVTFVDFITLAENYGGAGSWRDGDFDRTGTVNFPDFLVQSQNFGMARDRRSVSTPEPTSVLLLLWGLLVVRRYVSH